MGGGLVLSPGLIIKQSPGIAWQGEGPLTWMNIKQSPGRSLEGCGERCLPASHVSPEPTALPSQHPRRASPSFLSCSHSFYPRRDSLATSSAAVQLFRFVATLSSRALPSPGTPARPYSHSIHSGLYLAVEGHLCAGLSACVPFPASLGPRHARLPFPVLGHPVATAFDFWSFPTSHRGGGGVA